MEELWLRFRERFLESAHKRLSRARTLSTSESSNAAALASELHALAGEASVLGLDEVAQLARNGERAARSWKTKGDGGAEDRGVCATTLDNLEAAVQTLATK